MDTVRNLFPAWQKQIDQLYQEDADFQEMCQDYEEVHSLLAGWTASTDVKQAIIEEYKILLKDLKVEIIEALQANIQPVEPPEEETTTDPPKNTDPTSQTS